MMKKSLLLLNISCHLLHYPISDLLDQVLKLYWGHSSSVDCSILLDCLHNAFFYLWNQMISIIAYCVEHLLIILLHGSKNSRIDLQVLLISRIDLLVLTDNSVLCILPSVSCCLDADQHYLLGI
jgi:hypothetical protein